MKKMLITGFEPFAGMSINPSFEAVNMLKNQYNDTQIFKKQIPTAYYESIRIMKEMMESIQPDYILMLGQAIGRQAISIERIAINIDDASIPDNLGVKPFNNPIYEDGNAAYFSNLPIYNMLNTLKNQGINAEISNSAGTFVCNHLMYSTLYEIDTNKLPIKAGFIHVPIIHEQNLKHQFFSMSLDEIVHAIEILIEVITKEVL